MTGNNYGADALFILLGAIMILAMHAGFAFLELGVWPLHGLCGAWGGIAAGIFGLKSLGGIGGVAFASQLVGTLTGVAIALAGGYAVYGALKATVGLRLDPEQEFQGADLSIHRITSTPERESNW